MLHQIVLLLAGYRYLHLRFLDAWQERQKMRRAPGDQHSQEDLIDDMVQRPLGTIASSSAPRRH
jgi:hypothetical protein